MVANIIDYNPDVKAYNAEINKIINECYLQFWLTQPWTFCQKTLDIYTLPDIVQSTTTITPSPSPRIPKHDIDNVSFSTGIGQSFFAEQVNMEGNYLILEGSDYSDNNGTYIIDKIDDDDTKIYVSKVSNRENRQFTDWKGVTTPTPLAETVQCTAQQRYLKLPRDCSQILSVGIRNQNEATEGIGMAMGPIRNLTRKKDEELNYRFDVTGTPSYFVVYDTMPNGFQDVTTFVPRANQDFHVDTTTFSGGWPQGKYEFKMSYVWHGVEGELSDAFSLTIDEGNTIPRFNTIDTAKYYARGLRKKFYVRLVELTGFNATTFEEDFFRDLADIPFIDIDTSGGRSFQGYFIMDDDETQLAWPQLRIPITTVDHLKGIPRYENAVTHRWRMRLHPRPTTSLPINVRYISYPALLEDDFDAPECPHDTHRYIVYRSCQEVLFKHGEDTQAIYYEKKADKEMQKIEERYLTQRSAEYIKEGIRGGRYSYKPYRKLSKTTGADGA